MYVHFGLAIQQHQMVRSAIYINKCWLESSMFDFKLNFSRSSELFVVKLSVFGELDSLYTWQNRTQGYTYRLFSSLLFQRHTHHIFMPQSDYFIQSDSSEQEFLEIRCGKWASRFYDIVPRKASSLFPSLFDSVNVFVAIFSRKILCVHFTGCTKPRTSHAPTPDDFWSYPKRLF